MLHFGTNEVRLSMRHQLRTLTSDELRLLQRYEAVANRAYEAVLAPTVAWHVCAARDGSALIPVEAAGDLPLKARQALWLCRRYYAMVYGMSYVIREFPRGLRLYFEGKLKPGSLSPQAQPSEQIASFLHSMISFSLKAEEALQMREFVDAILAAKGA
jgi:hypothetical protein